MSSVEELAKRLGRLEQRVARGTVSQLGHSSFEGGGITQYSSDGEQLIARYGEQYDGTSGAVLLNGPTPPQPLAPRLIPALGGFEVEVSGDFVPDGSGSMVVAPMDFRAFAIHLSKDGPEFVPTQATHRFSVPSASGGTLFVTATTENQWYCKVICVSEAGKLSAPSVAAGPVRANGVTAEDLAFDPADYAGTTIHYGPASSPPAAADIGGVGDVWLVETAAGPPAKYEIRRWDGDSWEPLVDQGAADSLAAALAAQQAAALKARVLTQPDEPTGLTATDKVIWVETDAGNRLRSWNGTGWDDLRLGSGAIQPQSLIASDVIATGTISAALLEAILVLATQVVAGDPNGVHARLTPTGLRVYRVDPVSGLPEEVARLGTETADYFGIVDTDGVLIAAIDDTGAVNARTANFREDITIAGLTLQQHLRATGLGQVGRWHGIITGLNGTYGIRSEYGICQFAFPVEAGRSYLIRFDGPPFYTVSASPSAEVYLRMRLNLDAAVRLVDGQHRVWPFSGFPDGRYQIPNRAVVYDSPYTGMLNVGLTLELGLAPNGSSVVKVPDDHEVVMEAYDMGYSLPGSAGQVTAMGGQLFGGPPPAPAASAVTQRDTGWMSPAGWRTFAGNGAERFDTPGPVQGWDPTGTNGDGAGFWWWNLPSITGTVDKVEVWLESLHTYYNSGGTGRLAPIRNGATYPVNNYKLAADYDVAGFPKPGSKIVDISGWKNLFHNNQGANRAIGVSVGSIGNTNLAYYIRFGGSSARLRIIYTQ